MVLISRFMALIGGLGVSQTVEEGGGWVRGREVGGRAGSREERGVT